MGTFVSLKSQFETRLGGNGAKNPVSIGKKYLIQKTSKRRVIPKCPL
jgi:hypothetical protein